MPRKLGHDRRLLVPFLGLRFLEHKAVGKDGPYGLAEQRRIARHCGLLPAIQKCQRRAQLFGRDVVISDTGDDLAALDRAVCGGRGGRFGRRRRWRRCARRGGLGRRFALRDRIPSDDR